MRYYWYGGEKYVRMKTKECVVCGHKNHAFNKAPVPPLIPIPVTAKIFWRVHVDLTAQLPTTKNGNKFIGIAVCAFCKYIEAKGNHPHIFIYFLLFYVEKRQNSNLPQQCCGINKAISRDLNFAVLQAKLMFCVVLLGLL